MNSFPGVLVDGNATQEGVGFRENITYDGPGIFGLGPGAMETNIDIYPHGAEEDCLFFIFSCG